MICEKNVEKDIYGYAPSATFLCQQLVPILLFDFIVDYKQTALIYW